MKIVKYSAAKINLLLDITARLESGYHSIYSIMQSVSLYDKISVKKNEDSKINIICQDPAIPKDESNTTYKAAREFFEYNKISGAGVDIEIDKNIPAKAGLGGGSSNAAAVLLALDELFSTDLPIKDLSSIGVRVGADVPFCLHGGTMLCQNIGDVLSPLPDLPMCHIVIVKPPSSVKTEEAFKEYSRKAWIRHPNKEYALEAVVRQDLVGLCRYSSNVFEQLVEVVERVEIKAVMRKFGALYAFMTGSGSAVCAVFEEDKIKEANLCKEELIKTYPQTYLTRPVKKSVTSNLEKFV